MEQQHQESPQKKQPLVSDYVKKLKTKFVPGFKYTLLISMAINFAMLVVGCVNVHRCPVNKHIPLFLIATGAIGLVSKLVSYIRNRISKHVQVHYIESALYSVEGIFFFLGSYWVYKEFQPSYNPLDGINYCNKGAYLFAFAYLTIVYIVALTLLIGFCCFMICLVLIARTCMKGVAEGMREAEAQETEAEEKLNKDEDGEKKP